ncbi:MAG: aminotransferase class IV [Leptospiraceae bacterium]|nr:aminotransferase class IV [Leptospiraceae bacterium]
MFLDKNGNLELASAANVSIFDYGFYYGFSVYETCFIKDSKAVFLKDHFKRLQFSLDHFSIPTDSNFYFNLEERIQKIISKNEIVLGRLRIIVSAGDISSGFGKNITSILLTEKILKEPESVSLTVTNIKKVYPAVFPPSTKLSSNIASLLSIIEAKKSGFDEGIMLTHNGIITEGSYCNLFWLKKNILFTPSLDSSILSGITRDKIIQAAKENSIEVREGIYTLNDLLSAEKVFISSSTRGLLRVNKLDNLEYENILPEIIEKIQLTYQKYLKDSL